MYVFVLKAKECRSTFESKRSVSPGFSTRNMLADFNKSDKIFLKCE